VDAVFYPVALNAIPKKKKQNPAKKSRPATKPRVQNERLRGWKEIASFLGQPVAASQRWARSGMPVMREGRFMYASRDGFSRYPGCEAGLDLPVRIATANMDLSSDLRRALSYERSGSR
jgi:hypothetical protein